MYRGVAQRRVVIGALISMLWIPLGCRQGAVRNDPGLGEMIASTDIGEGVLGPTDVIEVRVFEEPAMSGEFRVDADGTLSFPFLGGVRVAGLTPSQAATTIASGLQEGYLVEPIVSVFLKESNSRQVFVLGEVTKPGPYPYSDGMTIVEAIALAGGVGDQGAANQTRISRRVDGDERRFQVKLSAISTGAAPNVTLQPNDIIYVPRSAI